MKQYVSIDKRSKKAQKEYYAKQRLTWGVLNPVTRSVPSGKIYNRKKDKQTAASTIALIVVGLLSAIIIPLFKNII